MNRLMTITAVSLVASAASLAHAEDFTGGLAPDQWTSFTSHNGLTSVTQDTDNTIKFGYNFDGSFDPLNSGVQAWFTTIADRTGTISFDWIIKGNHGSIDARAELWLFSDAPGEIGTQVVPYVPVNGLFYTSGSASLNIVQGYRWGVVAGGRDADPQEIFNGTVLLANLAPTPGAGALGAMSVLMTVGRRRR